MYICIHIIGFRWDPNFRVGHMLIRAKALTGTKMTYLDTNVRFAGANTRLSKFREAATDYSMDCSQLARPKPPFIQLRVRPTQFMYRAQC